MTRTRIQKLKWAVFALFVSFCAAALGLCSAFQKSLPAMAAGKGSSFLEAPTNTAQITRVITTETNGDLSKENNYYSRYSFAYPKNDYGGTVWDATNDCFLTNSSSSNRTGKTTATWNSSSTPTAADLRKAKVLNFIGARNDTDNKGKTGYQIELIDFVDTEDLPITPFSDTNDTSTAPNERYKAWKYYLPKKTGLFNSAYESYTFLLYYAAVDISNSTVKNQLKNGYVESIDTTFKVKEIGSNVNDCDVRINAFIALANGTISQPITSWTSKVQESNYRFGVLKEGDEGDHKQTYWYNGSNGSNEYPVKLDIYGMTDRSSVIEASNILVIGFYAMMYFRVGGNAGTRYNWMSVPTITDFNINMNKGLWSSAQFASNNNGSMTGASGNTAQYRVNSGSYANMSTNQGSASILRRSDESLDIDTPISVGSKPANNYFFMGYNVYLKSETQPIYVYRKELKIGGDGCDISPSDFRGVAPLDVKFDVAYGQISLSATGYAYTGTGVVPNAVLHTTANGKEFKESYFRKVYIYRKVNNGTPENSTTEDAPIAIGDYQVCVKVYYNAGAKENEGQITSTKISNSNNSSYQHYKNNMSGGSYDYDSMGDDAICLGQSSWKDFSITTRNVTVSGIGNTNLEFNGSTQQPTYTESRNEASNKNYSFDVGGVSREVGYHILTLTIPNDSKTKDDKGQYIYKFVNAPAGTSIINNGLTLEIPYTINRKYLNWTVEGGGSKTYNGEEQEAPFDSSSFIDSLKTEMKFDEMNSSDKETLLANIGLSMIEGSVANAKNVGTYTVSYSLTGDDANNYTFSESTVAYSTTNVDTVVKDWKIIPYVVHVGLSETGYVYDATVQKPTVTIDWRNADNNTDTIKKLLNLGDLAKADEDLSDGEFKYADTYTVTITLNADEGGNRNYAFTYDEGVATYQDDVTWEITQASLVFTARSFSNRYGDEIPAFTGGANGIYDTKYGYTVSGYKGADSSLGFNNLISLFYPGFTVEYDPVEVNRYTNVGEYVIGIKADDSKITNATDIAKVRRNYEITYISGVYTVTKRDVTYTADSKTIDYGETVTLTGSTSDEALKRDMKTAVNATENKVTVNLSHNAGTSTGGYLNAGTYPIEVTPDGAGVGNYNFIPGKSATLTINQLTVKVTLQDFELTYGDTGPFDDEWQIIDTQKWQITEGDFLSKDVVRVLPHLVTKPTNGKLTVTNHDAVVDFDGTDAGNYDAKGVYDNGRSYAIVTVGKKSITYRLDSTDGVITGVYGDTYRNVDDVVWTATSNWTPLTGSLVDGSTMAYGEDVSVITRNLKLEESDCKFLKTSSGHLAVGTYPLVFSLVANSSAGRNYEVTFDKNPELTVEPRPIGISIATMSATYGDFYPQNIDDSVTLINGTTPATGETLRDLFGYVISVDTTDKEVEWEGKRDIYRFITAKPGEYEIEVKKSTNPLANNYAYLTGSPSEDYAVTQIFVVTKRSVAISITGLEVKFGTDAATEEGVNRALATCIRVSDPMDELFPEFQIGQMPFVIDTSNLKGVSLYEWNENKYFPANSYRLPITVLDGYEYKYEIKDKISGALSIGKGEYDMSGIEFEDITPDYDGNPHRPQIKGTLPTGIDGIKVSVSYSGRTVTNVSDGTQTTTATFMSVSTNYDLPTPITATAAVQPRTVHVQADDQSAEYCGNEAGLNFNSSKYSVTSGSLVGNDSLGLVLTKKGGWVCGRYDITFDSDSGNPNYKIIATKGTFTVERRDINKSSVEVSGINADGYVYTGKAIDPAGISVADRGLAAGHQVLTRNTDYSLGYDNNINVARDSGGNVLASAQMIFEGQGNFKGTFTINFMILPKEISKNIFVGAISPMVYNGNPQTPSSFEVQDTDRTTALTGNDFTVSYNNNTNASESAQVILTGKGNYTGTYIVYYTIQPCDVKNLGIASIADQEYSRNQIFPKPTVTLNSVALTDGTDFTYSYGPNTNVGEGLVTVVGRGNFTGSRTVTFDIVPKELTVDQSKVKDIVYSGNPQDLTVSFTGYIQGDSEPKARFTYYTASGLKLDDTPVNVGSYLADVNLAAGFDNYIIKPTQVSFQITPYEVKANWTIPKNMVYNGSYQTVRCDANMGLTDIKTKADIAIVYYFVNGENETKVDAPRSAGSYRAVAVLDSLSSTSKNFTLKENDEDFPTQQTFSIGKATLNVTPALYKKSFGDPDGIYTAQVQGLGEDGELQVAFSRSVSYSKEDWIANNSINWREFEQTSATPYRFDAVEFTSVGYSDNYDLVLTVGEGSGLRIDARVIDKVAPTFEKYYGQDDPDFIEEWDSGYFGIKAIITYERATGNNVGSYSFVSFTMEPDSADRDLSDYANFSVNFARDGARNKFIINPVHVKYQIADVYKTFGQDDSVLEYEWKQIVEENVEVPSLDVTVHRAEGESAISSGYLINLTLSNPNYIAEIDRTEENYGGRLYIQRLTIETTDSIETERTYNGTNVVTATSVDNNIPEAYRVATNFRVVATFSQSNVGEGIDIYIHYEVNDRVLTNYVLPEDRILEGEGKITPRTLKVWIDDFSMEYGEEIPAITLRYDNLIAGDQLGSAIIQEPTPNFGEFGVNAPVGNYVITLNNDGQSLNYNFDVTDTANVNVQRAPISVTVNEGKGTFVQTVNGNKIVDLDNDWFLFGGLKNGDVATVLHKASFDSIEPGDTTITVEFSESENGNYYLLNRFVTVPAYLKPLPVIKFDNVRAVYSGEAVSITPNVTVIKPENGSILTVGYAVRYVGVNYDSYEAPVNAGSYTVYVESVDDYYDTVRMEGSLQIDKAPVRIFISGSLKQTYGEFSELSAVARGTDREFNLTVKYPFDDVRPQAGTHTVEATFAGNENYLPNSSTAELIIQPRMIQVSFSEFQNLVYNGQPQPITATFTGVLEGDTCDPVIIYSSGSVPKDAGTYNATVTPSNSSYAISGNMMQVFTIQKRKLTITANGGTVNAGEKPDTQLVFDGFVSGEGVGDIKDLPNVSISGVSIGENNIHLSGGEDDNYDFVLETGTFTVVYEKATAEKSSGSVIWIVISCVLGVALLITVIALIARKKQENEYTKERSHRIGF